MKNETRNLICALSLLLVLFLPVASFAHSEDYIDGTLVFMTLERGTIAPEYWYDSGRETFTLHNFVQHTFAAEYGIRNHWMVSGGAGWRHEHQAATLFESARLGTRYRFGEEGDRPIDVAISGEVNVLRPPAGPDQYFFAPRLILSRNVDKLNVTVNLPVDIALSGGTGTATMLAFGARYDLFNSFGFGGEFKYNIDKQAGAIIPQIWLGYSENLAIQLGYSAPIAVDKTLNQDRLLRLAIKAEF